MNKYTILCTKEQTKKALELGAPIDFIEEGKSVSRPYLYEPQKWGYYVIPTAEQMMGWLEEHRIFVHIDYDFFNNDKPYKCEMCLLNGMTNHRGWFISRKEATLAAIDKALDFLIENKKK